jgi:hypothetical protein
MKRTFVSPWCRSERFGKRASEKEPVARPSSNKDVSLKNQEGAELLRGRIVELDRRLAILNSERTLWQRFRPYSDGCGCCRIRPWDV